MKLILKSIIVIFGLMLIMGSTHIADLLPQIPLKELGLYSVGVMMMLIGVFTLNKRSYK